MTQPRMISHTSAGAIGYGILTAIRAVAGNIETPDAYAHRCLTAAHEAYQAVLENPPVTKRKLDAAEALLEELRKRRADAEDTTQPAPAVERLEGAALEQAAHAAACEAFRFCIPHIVNRRSIQALITCAVVGQLHGYLSGKDTNSLLYAAQQALAAHPKRRSTNGRK